MKEWGDFGFDPARWRALLSLLKKFQFATSTRAYLINDLWLFISCPLRKSGYRADMRLILEMPEDAFSSLRQAPDEFATELKLAACVKWYEIGRLSQAKAAEIAGLSRAAFIDSLRSYRVSAIQVEPGKLKDELAQ